MRKLVLILLVLIVAAGAAFVVAGLQPKPAITFTQPGDFAGSAIPVELEVTSATPANVEIAFEQNGTRTAAVTPPPGSSFIKSTISSATVPGLKVTAGPAKLIVTASRRVWGFRTVTAESTKNITIRLEKPRVSVVSSKHYINLGGSEMIVYRASPDDVVSGVRVGDIEYPGFPYKDGRKIAFFALRYDQPVNAPMKLFARDLAGEEATSDFDHTTFTKPFKKSTIPLDDKFIDRVVPAILAGTTEIAPTGSTIEKFVVINSELRQKNNAKIHSMAAETAPEMLWKGQVFFPFGNTKAEAAFADFRTYTYQGKEVDKQVHLGFDLASFANTSIVAANRGKIVYAAELGIYGNCIIIDHGMGVQSLYGHLSVIGVKVGDMVEKGQEIGKSGMTGLAAGDHLHFTMLVNGQMVNPIEWWDEHWIQDRILRKLQ
jgi:murein DD-endopeptidase MepM/ murein hydrolase activator NlpD